MRKFASSVIFSGYTLIEILIGITIIGLLFSFGFLNYRDYARRQALLGAARSLKADLRLAQEQALAGKKPSSVECDSPQILNGYDFFLESSTSYKIQANCSDGLVDIKEVDISSLDISLSSSHSRFTFKVVGQGTSIDGYATLTFTQDVTNRTQDVTVSSNGEIK